MVERTATVPVYDIEQIRLLAERGDAEWRGPNAQERCWQELQLTFDQVCEELTYLQPADFVKRFRYENDPMPDDGYKMKIRDGMGRYVWAYIKVRIIDDGLVLDIGSFHGSFDWVNDE